MPGFRNNVYVRGYLPIGALGARMHGPPGLCWVWYGFGTGLVMQNSRDPGHFGRAMRVGGQR